MRLFTASTAQPALRSASQREGVRKHPKAWVAAYAPLYDSESLMQRAPPATAGQRPFTSTPSPPHLHTSMQPTAATGGDCGSDGVQ